MTAKSTLVYPPRCKKTDARFKAILSLIEEDPGKEFTPKTIADILEVKRDRVYATLELMAKNEVISSRKDGKAKYYFANKDKPRTSTGLEVDSFIGEYVGDPLKHPVLGWLRQRAYDKALDKVKNPAKALLLVLNEYPDQEAIA